MMEEDDIEKKDKKSWKDKFLNLFKIDKTKYTRVGFSLLCRDYPKPNNLAIGYSGQSEKGRNMLIFFIGNMLFLYLLHLFYKEMIISDEVYYGLKKLNFLFPNVDGAFENAVVVKGVIVARESFFGVAWLWFFWVTYFTVDLILGIIIKKKELEAESKVLIPFIKSTDNIKRKFAIFLGVCMFLLTLFFLDELLNSSRPGAGKTTVFMSIWRLVFIGQGLIAGIAFYLKVLIADLIVVFIYYLFFLKKERQGVS